jgi:hypothetical protein
MLEISFSEPDGTPDTFANTALIYGHGGMMHMVLAVDRPADGQPPKSAGPVERRVVARLVMHPDAALALAKLTQEGIEAKAHSTDLALVKSKSGLNRA